VEKKEWERGKQPLLVEILTTVELDKICLENDLQYQPRDWLGRTSPK